MKPRLVYDGDCEFCRYTVEYAAPVPSDAVECRPYQRVMAEYPEIAKAEFAGSIQLFVDGARYERADAACRTLAIGGLAFWDWLYRRLPGFAAVSNAVYDWVSRHRAPASLWHGPYSDGDCAEPSSASRPISSSGASRSAASSPSSPSGGRSMG